MVEILTGEVIGLIIDDNIFMVLRIMKSSITLSRRKASKLKALITRPSHN